MLEKSINSRDKLTLTNANFHSMDLNHSLSNSYLTTSYIKVKNNSKKKKRHVNSYMEEFLEKRRMAAEFAQSKRSTSSKNNRAKLTEDEKNNEYDINMNIKKIEETINIKNLKNNLPGKTTALIDNTNNLKKYITSSNKINNISRENNNYNKYNNFKRHNIVYTKKTNLSQNTGKNNTNVTNITNISNHSFTENRYNTNHENENEEQCNIINTNENKIEDISPIKQNHIILNAKGGIDITSTENKNIEEKKEKENIIENKELNKSEHFLSILEKMIKNVDMNMNKSQSSEKDINQFNKISLSQNNNNFTKYKEFEKYLNKTEKNILDLNNKNKTEESNEEENQINKDNNIDNNEEGFFITNLNKEENSNDIEKNKEINYINDIINKEQNNNQKISEEYIVEENEEKNMNLAYKKEEENDNEEIEQEKSVNRQEEQEEENEEENNMSNNNNEEEEENEDIERCEVLKGDGDKSKYLKRKNNIITEEILEVEEGTEINENTGEFPTVKSGRNKNSTRNKNENNELVLNKLNKEIDKEMDKEKNEDKGINKEKKEDKNNNSGQKEEKKYNNLNKIEIKDLKKNKSINEKSNNINKNYNFIYSNHTNKENNNNILENIEYIEYNTTSNYNEHNNILNISKSNKKEEEKISYSNNDDFNLNKLSDIKNINTEINEMVETPEETNYENIEKNYKEKEDFFKIINKDIERLEKIRNSNNNNIKEDESYLYEIDNFINLIKEKRKSVNNNNILLNDINSIKNINKKDYIPPKNILELKKIYKNLNKNNLNITTESNYNNNIINRINYNKMKLPISKSSSLQSLLNEIKKDKTYNINISNININNDNKIINNNFFTEKINKEINDSINNINNNISKDSEENSKNDFKLFDETKFRKIKETNLRKRNKFRTEFKFKDYQTNKNMSHMYLDKVKEDLLMNISEIKYVNRNEAKNKFNMKKFSYLNNTEYDLDNSEIMPANNMKSLYFNKL